MPDITAALDELAVMRRLVAALEKLTPAARARVIAYLADRYAPRPTSQEIVMGVAKETGGA
jgi:hypothetical protein